MLLLGILHFVYTIRGPKLHPRDADLEARMMAVSPVISPQTTMWRAWVGFNLSHSLCLIFFGTLYSYLALRHSTFLVHSWFLLLLGFVLLLAYAILAKLYWFSVPFVGVVIAAFLYLLVIVIRRA
jgi:hypothetical protein